MTKMTCILNIDIDTGKEWRTIDSAYIKRVGVRVLRSGKVVFEDFDYQDEFDYWDADFKAKVLA